MSSAENATTVVVPQTGHYTIDPARTTVRFDTRHLFGLGPVTGTFAVRGGTVDVADPATESTVAVVVDSASFDTGSKGRDKQVRSAKFLDVESHPVIRFEGQSARKSADGWQIAGTLTVQAVTRPLDLEIQQLTVAGSELRARVTCRIDRKEYGITAMPGMAGRHLTLTVEAVAAS
jgi:polyisoprenoid-binding protein YceI